MLLDRLLTKCSEHLSIFAAPVVLDRDYDISADACDLVLDVVRQNVPLRGRRPAAHLDAVGRSGCCCRPTRSSSPPCPTSPTCATPRTSIDLLKQNRANDGPAAPRHQHGQDAEAPGDLGQGVRGRRSTSRRSQVIEFDSETFGLASNNGQMIEEFAAKAKSGASSSATWR